MRQAFSGDDAAELEIKWHIRPDDEANGRGSGYVVDSLQSAVMLLTNDSYEKVVKAAIRLGNDTDTTACIAGGIAGLKWGEESIPTRWLTALRGRDMVEPLLVRLVDHIVR